jgi:hypothetical protein
VHPSQGRTFGPAQDWGDGPAFVSTREQVVTGDWNGDGFEDIAFRGPCADGSEPCWQVGVNRHGKFVFEDWGPAQSGELAGSTSADVDGDGSDELIYGGPCDASRICWLSLAEGQDRFSNPVNLGLAQPTELERKWMFDYDGDGDADLLTVEGDPDSEAIVFRRSGLDGLADPVIVSTSTGKIRDMWYRSRGTARPIEAVIARSCDEGICTAIELELSGRLYAEKDYRALVYFPMRIGPGFTPV